MATSSINWSGLKKAFTVGVVEASQAADLDGATKALQKHLQAHSKSFAAPDGKLEPIEGDALCWGFRNQLEALTTAASKKGVPAIKEPAVVQILDLSFECVSKKWASTSLPLQLLNDLFETQSASECQSAFDYVEARVDKLKKEFMTEDLRYILVSTCNTLMKRLSKCSDLVLCSRILMFLAHVLPLSEKSGVNKKSLFNAENVTFYETVDPSAPEDDAMTDDSAPASAPKPAAADSVVVAPGDDELHVNFQFYRTFWELQTLMHDPSAVAGNPDTLQNFCTLLDSVLTVFAAHPFSASEEAALLRSLRYKEFFFPKFLTSTKLIGLQLRDIYFRRHCLVQVLLVLQYLRDNSLRATPLTAAQLEKLARLGGKCDQLLSKIPPNAQGFSSTIRRLLKREQNWISWKKSSCPPFERPPAQPVAEPITGVKRAPIANNLPDTKKRYVDTAALNVQATLHLSSLAAAEPAPTLESFLADVRAEMQPSCTVPPEFKRNADLKYVWKALRTASKSCFLGFSRANKESQFLHAVVQEVDKEAKGEAAENKSAAADKEQEEAIADPEEPIAQGEEVEEGETTGKSEPDAMAE